MCRYREHAYGFEPDSNWCDPDAILADPDAHPVHKMFAEINIGIRDRGERWAKCYECGEPIWLTALWGSDMFCCAAHADVAIRRLISDDRSHD